MMIELQAPLPLAQLPRPLDAEGKTLFNSVHGLSNLRKVKRYEIVAAVDGEAINLYDVIIDSFVPSQILKRLIVATGAIIPVDHIIFCASTVVLSMPTMFNPAEN